MVPFKCDVHGWMNAYVGVLDHPYFAVTERRRQVRAEGAAAGTYTIEAWHEKLGADDAERDDRATRRTKEVTFTFKAPAAATD